MAIQEINKRMYFTPFTKKVVVHEDVPSLTVRLGVVLFNKATIAELALDKKFVKLFYDTSKANPIIGFTVKDVVPLENLKSGSGRWYPIAVTSGTTCTASAKRDVHSVFGEEVANSFYRNVPLKKYVEKSSVIDKGTTYYFVELEKEYKEEMKTYKKKEPEYGQEQ